MKGTCQKFETLSDGSIKLSIYFPREFKRQVIELSDEEVEVVLAKDFQLLTSGENYTVPKAFISGPQPYFKGFI